MRLTNFDYNLPKELIAQYPLKERDACRLMVINRKGQTIKHLVFKNLTDYLRKGDLLVLNDTKVLPSRLQGLRKTGGKVEVLLIKQKSSSAFSALIKPNRLRLNEEIIFNSNSITGIINAKNEITFNTQDIASIYKLGVMPLPPYIKRNPSDLDNTYYQTVYARHRGAIASATAGLHFTKELLKNLGSQGINIAYITLHIGLGTFKPVKSENITGHKMEPEYFKVPGGTERLIKRARQEDTRIFAVGTTSLRALEIYAVGQKEGYTDLFVYPGYKFKMVDCLLTNFHLPRTTLFMLVCAFAGQGLIKKAYQEAIDKKYRFYSYGDAMLIV